MVYYSYLGMVHWIRTWSIGVDLTSDPRHASPNRSLSVVAREHATPPTMLMFNARGLMYALIQDQYGASVM